MVVKGSKLDSFGAIKLTFWVFFKKSASCFCYQKAPQNSFLILDPDYMIPCKKTKYH